MGKSSFSKKAAFAYPLLEKTSFFPIACRRREERRVIQYIPDGARQGQNHSMSGDSVGIWNLRRNKACFLKSALYEIGSRVLLLSSQKLLSKAALLFLPEHISLN